MKISKGNICRRVLVGLRARVLRHLDPALEGLEGVVVWDSARALLILGSDGRRRLVLKEGAKFLITTPEGVDIEVDGDKLMVRPTERAKASRC